MRKFLLYLCLAIILISVVNYLEQKKIIPSPPPPHITTSFSPTPSSATASAVLGENAGSLCHARQINTADAQAVLPDATCTPGVIDPRVTQDNIFDTICKSGYTKTVRPRLSYTGTLKRVQIQQYGYTDTDPKHYEEDHLISLELGGSPDDPKNLWPEPGSSINEKDKVENFLHGQVCSGAMTLSQAQEAIRSNWYQLYLDNHLDR